MIEAKCTPHMAEEVIKETMLHVYCKKGFLPPTLFCLTDGRLDIQKFPEEVLTDPLIRENFAQELRQKAKADKKIECYGLFYDDYGTICNKDSEMSGMISGEDLNCSQDYITREKIVSMVFSSRKKDYFLSCTVDPETKTFRQFFNRTSEFKGVFANLIEKDAPRIRKVAAPGLSENV